MLVVIVLKIKQVTFSCETFAFKYIYSENSYVVILSKIEQFYICTSVRALKSDSMLTRNGSIQISRHSSNFLLSFILYSNVLVLILQCDV